MFLHYTDIVKQLKEYNVFLNGSILLGKIEEILRGDIEEIDVLHQKTFDVELKVRGIDPDVISVFGNPNTRLEVRGTLENEQGETVQARWVFVGKVLQRPFEFSGMTVFTLKCNFCEHHIDGEEQCYIDTRNCIHRIDGVDRLADIRAALEI